MKASFSEHDAGFMRRALQLAGRGQGYVEPNPMVGAVLVKNGRVVGEGYHHHFGGPHAEVVALKNAGGRARGATLYVTLEPCCHWGKTPPCTDAILAAGITRVVAAMIDPFSSVAGRGAEILRRARVKVGVGLLEAEARRLNSPFITRLTKHRPYVIAKWAQSVDGCIATASGDSRWISSETSRGWVHRLRGRADAILVGIGTVVADDPLLTARPDRGRDIRRIATRIVLDSQCRLPVNSQLVRTIPFAPLLLAHEQTLNPAAEKRRRALADKGVMTVPVPMDIQGNLKVSALLRHLSALEYTNLLLEGGGQVLGSFFRSRMVDEIHAFIAPIIIGGTQSHHAVAGPDIKHIRAAERFDLVASERSGPDLHLTLRASEESRKA